MIPLTMMETGDCVPIKKIGGKEEIRLFLERLGFVPGSNVSVVTKSGGNVIVNVKNSRVAISSGMASKILV
jgi:ferrous iron transport protein A